MNAKELLPLCFSIGGFATIMSLLAEFYGMPGRDMWFGESVGILTITLVILIDWFVEVYRYKS